MIYPFTLFCFAIPIAYLLYLYVLFTHGQSVKVRQHIFGASNLRVSDVKKYILMFKDKKIYSTIQKYYGIFYII